MQFLTLCVAGMQNLSISCALVCLIILGSSALVGTFGVLKHQISAVLVTGVMYLLAGQTVHCFFIILTRNCFKCSEQVADTSLRDVIARNTHPDNSST